MVAAPAWRYPRWVAHRGGGSLAPENTLLAFETGLQRGYRAAELDAVLAQDGVAVLLHDETLERTTNGRGLVADVPSAALMNLDAGSWFGPQFAQARIPSLQEILAFSQARGMWLNIEIKPVPGHEERTGAVVAAQVAAAWPGGSRADAQVPLLSSFSRAALEAARRVAPQLARGLLCGALPDDWESAARALDCVAVHCDHRRLTQAAAQRIAAAGFGMLCYTVNELERARTLRAWGVDAICTDRIDLLDPTAE